MNTKSKVGSGESSVASMGKRPTCKVRKLLSFGGSDEAMCLSDRRTKDSDGFDFEVENSHFSVDASKSNPCGREGNNFDVSFYILLLAFPLLLKIIRILGFSRAD